MKLTRTLRVGLWKHQNGWVEVNNTKPRDALLAAGCEFIGYWAPTFNPDEELPRCDQ